MSTTETAAEELERLRAENEALRAAKTTYTLTFKVAEKGGVSVYGHGQKFPTTLYKDQWRAILDQQAELVDFMFDNEDKLKNKNG